VREERDGIDVKTPAVKDVLDGDFDQFMHAFLRHKTATRQPREKSNSGFQMQIYDFRLKTTPSAADRVGLSIINHKSAI